MDKTVILSRLDKLHFYRSLLPDLRENGKPETVTRCPFHSDTHPSLSINLESGLYNCFSCGEGGDVFKFYQRIHNTDFPTALKEISRMAGVEVSPSNGHGKVVGVFEYKDADGNVLYAKERVEPGRDGRLKEFYFKHNENGQQVNGRGSDAVPYNLPELVNSKYCIFLEGEKKVDLLKEWGLVATSFDSGANSRWREAYLPYFKGKEKIIILPDNDTPGREYATKIAKTLHVHVEEIKIVELPGLPEKGDIVDYKRQGGTKEELLELIKEAPIWSPPENNSGEGEGLNSLISCNSSTRWPELKPEALHGLAGDVVKTIEPQSEADPAALLINFLVSFGNAIGDRPHFMAEADRHTMRLFAICVGETSKGRKGTAWGHNKRIFRTVEPEWEMEHVISGLSSGEGLIWAVRDPIEKKEEIIDEGIHDKRLLVLESEFSSVLRILRREGNTLSAIVRQAWDNGNLRTLTKNSPAKATGAHISILGHITKNELLRYLDDTEAGNGFGNRFLWLCVKRSKTLPEGGGCINIDPLVERLNEALEFAKSTKEIKRNGEARLIWKEIYPGLSDGKLGLFGMLTSRAEAQAMRMACIYALLDKSSVVRPEHLVASLALWEYCENSVRYIFGDATGDHVVDSIVMALEQAPEGLSRSKIHSLFGRNLKVNRIDRALESLTSTGSVRSEVSLTEGARRPTEFFHLSGLRI